METHPVFQFFNLQILLILISFPDFPQGMDCYLDMYHKTNYFLSKLLLEIMFITATVKAKLDVPEQRHICQQRYVEDPSEGWKSCAISLYA